MERKRPFDGEVTGIPNVEPSRKRSRFDDAGAAPAPSATSQAALPVDGAARAAAAAAAVAARLMGSGPAAGVTGAGAPSSIAQAAILAAQRAATFKAQQKASIGQSGLSRSAVDDRPTAAQLGGSASARRTTELPPPLVLDASGKPVNDALAAVMSIPSGPVASLKINAATRVAPKPQQTAFGDVQGTRRDRERDAKAAEEAVVRSNPYLAHRRADASASADASGDPSADPSIIDPRLPVPGGRAARAERALQFVEPGAIAAKAERLRAKAAKSAQVAVFREAGSRLRPVFHREGDAAEGEEGAQPPAVASKPKVPPKHTGAIPDAEWWDVPFLPPARQRAYHARSAALATEAAAAAQARRRPARAAVAAAPSELADGEASMDGHADPASAPVSAAPASEQPPASSSHPTFSYQEMSLSHAKTAPYVQHPVPEAPAGGDEQPLALPLILTAQERKRLRRQARAERLRGVQDQVRLGILPAPEPKVRLANLMRVLKDSAVADPSAVEKRVREQVAARVRNHDMRNLASKLTPGERREKWKRKMSAHGGCGPDVALFRVSDLSNKQARFKVDVNANENWLTGVVLEARNAGLAPPLPSQLQGGKGASSSAEGAGGDGGAAATSAPVTLVLVEGGTRAVRKYVRLMTQRIHWRKAAAAAARGGQDAGSDDDEEDEDDDGEAEEALAVAGITAKGVGAGPGSLCELVWRGTSPRRFFDDFRFESARSPPTARKLLEARGLAHMWDLVLGSAQRAAGSGGFDAAAVSGSFASAGFRAGAGGASVSDGGSVSQPDGGFMDGDDSDEDEEEGGEEEQEQAAAR